MRELLIATDNYLPRRDGIAVFLSEIIPLLKKKFHVTLITPKFTGKMQTETGVKIIKVPLSGIQLGDYPVAKLAPRKIKEATEGADIVWVQTLGPVGLTALHYAKKKKKKLIAFNHSIEWELFSYSITREKLFYKAMKGAIKTLAKRFYNKCDILIVPTEAIGRLLEENGIKPRKEVVNLGVDVARFIPPMNKAKAKRNIKINPRLTVIGYLGRIGREKDLPALVEAFQKVRKKYRNVMLLIVGGGLKGEVLQDRKVIVTGVVENVVPYLQAMDIYVLPSLTETTSLTTMEAMSCGLPVVVTKAGFVKEYVKEGYSGYFFEKRDSDMLSKKLEKLLKSGKTRERLGANARKTIVKRFKWEESAKKIVRILEELKP